MKESIVIATAILIGGWLLYSANVRESLALENLQLPPLLSEVEK